MDWKQLFTFRFTPNKKSVVTVSGIDSVNDVPIYGTHLSTMYSNAATTERERIKRYREASTYNEIAIAVKEVVDGMLVYDESLPSIDLSFSKKIPKRLGKRIREIWLDLYNRLNLDHELQKILTRWYVDGRLYIHPLIDEDNEEIFKLNVLDALNISKVNFVEIDRNSTNLSLVNIPTGNTNANMYFVYENNSSFMSGDKIAIHADNLIYADSGIVNDKGEIVSSLEKSMIPYTVIKQMESSVAIYRLARAPLKNVFYFDVTGLQGKKAEEYIEKQKEKFKSEITFNSATGVFDDKRGGLSVIDNYYLPRNNGNTSTEIRPLDTTMSTNNIEDIEFEYKRLLASLDIPSTRFNNENSVFNEETKITYAEHKFRRLIKSFRKNISSSVLLELLLTELLIKRIISEDDKNYIKLNVTFDWIDDTFFKEDSEISKLNEQLDTLNKGKELVGDYIDKDWLIAQVLPNIEKERLKHDTEEINEEA